MADNKKSKRKNAKVTTDDNKTVVVYPKNNSESFSEVIEELITTSSEEISSDETTKSDDSDVQSVVQRVREQCVLTQKNQVWKSFVKCKNYVTNILLNIVNTLVAFMYFLLLCVPYISARTDPRAKMFGLLRFMLRHQWDPSETINTRKTRKTFKSKRVVVVQTDTDECTTVEKCTTALRNMQFKTLQMYNFVISPDGYVFEVHGWTYPSPMFPDEPTLVVAFLGKGSFETKMPKTDQLDQLKNLLKESNRVGFLDTSFTIFGRKMKQKSTKLFECLATWKEWDSKLYDSDEFEDEEVDYFDEYFGP